MGINIELCWKVPKFMDQTKSNIIRSLETQSQLLKDEYEKYKRKHEGELEDTSE